MTLATRQSLPATDAIASIAASRPFQVELVLDRDRMRSRTSKKLSLRQLRPKRRTERCYEEGSFRGALRFRKKPRLVQLAPNAEIFGARRFSY
jgi:hypothetical protein